MNWKLEVVVIPVTDVDRSTRFSREKLGFKVDVDTVVGEMRVVWLTAKPGSACSVVIGPAILEEVPQGSTSLQLSVSEHRSHTHSASPPGCPSW